MYLQDQAFPGSGEATLRFDKRVDAPTATAIKASGQEETPRDVRALWPELVERVYQGDHRAAVDMARLCRPGIHLLLKLNLGAVGLDHLVDETVAGAVDCVRRGRIREPRDLADFVRSVIQRQAPKSGHGASDQARARRRSVSIERALRNFRPDEKLWLRRFYVEGWESAQISAASGMSESAFSELRRRLREEAGIPSNTSRTQRAAAANSV